jgi:hypothetical protein
MWAMVVKKFQMTEYVRERRVPNAMTAFAIF